METEEPLNSLGKQHKCWKNNLEYTWPKEINITEVFYKFYSIITSLLHALQPYAAVLHNAHIHFKFYTGTISKG